ncbi:MAG: sigma-70 family RNA polymerase sigma factor [Candidatus Ratteibacteria bacterium]|nr:sigma-70 family RNA polymerase sigma factor [Candidatus Ratteibacteria bacterium]
MEKEIELKIKRLIKKDDCSALEVIYDEIGKNLYKYILSILCSDSKAEEVMQNLFVAIAEKRNRVATARNLTGYIFAMARNQAFSFIRNEPKHERNIEDYKNILILNNSDNRPDKNELEQITHALSSLPVGQKEVISMKIFQDMTFEEIGKILNISVNTAASRYRYGIEKLRIKLKELQDEI